MRKESTLPSTVAVRLLLFQGLLPPRTKQISSTRGLGCGHQTFHIHWLCRVDGVSGTLFKQALLICSHQLGSYLVSWKGDIDTQVNVHCIINLSIFSNYRYDVLGLYSGADMVPSTQHRLFHNWDFC